ncbi:MAG: hypothetical protein MI757_18505, partial [Pirellulales bacterium]|nr:hypothetical protein [Pirellulales bacterium]
LEQRRFLLRRDLLDVGIYDKRVEITERFGIKILYAIRVPHVDAAFFQNWHELRRTVGRLMMAVVAKKQHPEPIVGRGWCC